MLWWLVHNTVLTALLALGVALLCWLARPRPALRHALWLIVLCKLVTPPIVYWPWPVPALAWLGDSGAHVERPADVPTFARLIIEDRLPEQLKALPPAPVERSSPSPGVVEQLASPPESAIEEDGAPPPLSWWQVVSPEFVFLSLWASGAMVLLAMQVVGALRFCKRLRVGLNAPPSLDRELALLAQRMHVRPPRVRIVAPLSSPLLWSLGRPVLLWPAELLDRLSAASRRGVLVHELAHLRRRDHWVGRLLLVAGWLWWWNPLYWLVRRELHRNAELACDAWVVGTLPRDRRPYAEALLEVIERVSRTTAPQPGLGMGTSRRDVERRLTMIMRESAPCRVPAWGLPLLGLLAVLAVPAWSLAQQETKDTANTPPPGDVINLSNGGVAGLVIDKDNRINVNHVQGRAVIFSDAEDNLNQAQNWISVLNQVEDPTPDADREKRLERLERQLQTMLKEVQALRGKAKATQPARQQQAQNLNQYWTTGQFVPQANWSSAAPQGNGTLWFANTLQQPQNYQWSYPVNHVSDPVPGVTLSRVTYALSKDKADVLAWFLRDYVKAQVFETKQDGEKLTITTTPGVQKDVGRLIASMQGQAVQQSNQKSAPKSPENPKAKPQEKPQPKSS
jgi:beta-lactamase regulating signal transducer with metallopeptidase domain